MLRRALRAACMQEVIGERKKKNITAQKAVNSN
jgi:hypothetical protein